MFHHNSTHRVVVCTLCHSCIIPGSNGQERHLRAEPHRLTGNPLKTAVKLLQSYNLRSVEEIRTLSPRTACIPLDYLSTYDGFKCLQPECPFTTRNITSIQAHVSKIHEIKPKEHSKTPLWKSCKLQTFFTAKGLINYFVVLEGINPVALAPLPKPTEDLFEKLKQDLGKVKSDMQEQAGIVSDFGDSRSERVPWLERTGFPNHLAKLKDEEIRSSFQLPSKKELGGATEDATDSDLVEIILAAEIVLRDAHGLCSDISPNRKMTQQRAVILNDFYSDASGKAKGFRDFKIPSTLVTYFTTMKQLLVYYYRVVYKSDGHFTPSEPDQMLPKQIIQSTPGQVEAMNQIIQGLANKDQTLRAVQVKKGVVRLYLALICQTVGSVPFRSPVLSFCAMLSRQIRGKGHGLWKEPGNYNSHLSALIWTSQIMIFYVVCRKQEADEERIPETLKEVCQAYFHQVTETPFGHILQWRLYLFKVAKESIAKHQARWNLSCDTVEYRGVELQMTQISDLVLSEYQQARTLLHDELLFQATDMTPMESWRLKDDLDVQEFGYSWLSHPGNNDLVHRTEGRLLQRIQDNPELRAMFTTGTSDGTMALSAEAVEIYEAQVQEFLKRLLVLCHISPGPPLREPELLSVTLRNGARQRHVFIWEKLVLLYTQYHKGQQQTGLYKDNIRFLPKAVGDLALQYIAYVLPLRQIFLRQQNPKAILSPYLWATLDGTVWADGTLSRCLGKACTRAKVPRLHTSNWRQFAASITNVKFSAQERGNFDDEDLGGEEIEEERDLVAMAEQSNHSFHTFNHSYAGTTTLTMSSLLHRGHRASQSWQALFRFEQILQGKRPRGASETLSLRMLDDLKRGQLRKKGTYSEADLLGVARKLYNSPTMQFRLPGQREGILAVLGPQRAEEIILILGTGSGKTLLVMVGAAIPNAGSTILVLPMIALRNNMLERFRAVGIQPLLWTVDCKKLASLVIVSVEAACTQSFLEYCHLQTRKQELSRIVIDEAHLTLTATDYRSSMTDLAWYIRQIKTQTVWLTATLPPSRQAEFVRNNLLTKPRIIRESTNRPNIEYIVHCTEDPRGPFYAVQAFLNKISTVFNSERDRIIVYCRTREEVRVLSELLQCPQYTSHSGTEGEKAAIITTWLANRFNPVIVATSALSIGFDYAHVRYVLHVDEPDRLTDFAQESGRAGRDGQKATSIVFLYLGWKLEDNQPLDDDRIAMQLYLSRRYCLRGVLSQFLDLPSDWRWCMSGEVRCRVCPELHTEPRPRDKLYEILEWQEPEFTGPAEVLRQDYIRDQVLDNYISNLEVMSGSCLYCRAMGRAFDHVPTACSRRFDWIKAKTAALKVQKKAKKTWIKDYIVCWICFQPQDICHVQDQEHAEETCRFPDLIMPLCYGIFYRAGGIQWLKKHFKHTFRTELEYLIWLGESTTLTGNKCIQANCVAALAMGEFA